MKYQPMICFFKTLVNQTSSGSLDFMVGNESAAIDITSSDFKIKTNYKQLSVDIPISVKVHVRKYSGSRITPATVHKIKQGAEDKIKEETLRLLQEFQEEDVDPIGIKRKFMQQHRNFDKDQWEEQYQEVTFNVHPEVIIIETGTVD